MTKTSHPYFIANGDSRKDTATLLTGTAEEAGIDQHDIQATPSGFNITEAVYQAVYGDDQPETETGENDRIMDPAVSTDLGKAHPNPDPQPSTLDEGTLTGQVLAFDPSEHTVDEVKAYLDANPDEAEAILRAERNGKNRTSLVG